MRADVHSNNKCLQKVQVYLLRCTKDLDMKAFFFRKKKVEKYYSFASLLGHAVLVKKFVYGEI